MEFISLSEVLCNIAERIQLDRRFPCSNTRIGKISLAAADEFWYAKKNNHPFPDGNSIDEKIEWARKMGVAALYLNNAVLESPDAPLQWAEFDGNRRVNVSSDLIKKEALEIFEHAIGWGNRLDEKYNNHFRNAINQGDEALMLPVSVSQDEGLTRDGERIRLMQIGCDNEKLIVFLNANDVAHSLEIQKAPASEPVTPAALSALPPAAAAAAAALLEQTDDAGLSKREKQIRVIVSAIETLGFRAMSIPTGGKKIVETECKRVSTLFGGGSDPFKEAWQKAVEQNRVRTAKHCQYSRRIIFQPSGQSQTNIENRTKDTKNCKDSHISSVKSVFL